MRIRPIEPRDDAAVYNLVQSSLEAVGLDIPGTAYVDPQLDHLAEYYAGVEHAQYWVVDSDGQVVGGVGIAPVAGAVQVCELQKLYVARDHRGRGYATQLLDTALAFAARYYARCYLETHTKLTVARALYDRYGFTPLDGPLPGGEHSAMDCWAIEDLTNHHE